VAQRVLKKEKPGKVMRFSDIIKGRTSEGREKHIPYIGLLRGQGSKAKDRVEIEVGKEAPHPNTQEHHICWIQAFGVKKDGQVIDLRRKDFKAGEGKPLYVFDLDASDFKHLFAFSYCNQHGVWEWHMEL